MEIIQKAINFLSPQQKAYEKTFYSQSLRRRSLVENNNSIKPPNAKSRHLNSQNFLDDYKMDKELGKVRIATHKKTGKKFAVKCVDKNKLGKKDLSSFKRETSLLKNLHHQNIINYISLYQTDGIYFLITEVCNGGEFFDYLVSQKNNCISEKETLCVIKTLANILYFLSKHRVCHRDLKPENILLKYKNDISSRSLKLADFGFARQRRILSDKQSYTLERLHTVCGSPLYVAPEILKKEADGYGEEVDIWSLGVILHVCLVGYPPYNSESTKDLFALIKSPHEIQFSEEDFAKFIIPRNLLRRMLVKNPNRRYRVKDVLNHPWLFSEENNSQAGVTKVKKYKTNRTLRVNYSS
eukprot:snap_masked-scaffold_2-processed-gene-26.9-mRNA-1 protein AED:0.24 eAED:0.24 QI:0/0/0/1/1/1/2/0/353